LTSTGRLLRHVRAITGMRIHATDGDLGHVHDVYFDDGDWRVRYFHVDTRHALLGRHVLLAPAAVESVDWDGGHINVSLTREQVRNSPDIDSHKPVSRQHAMALSEYVPWPLASSVSVWEGEQLAARLHEVLIEMHVEDAPSPERRPDEAHLWSARALHHYPVERDQATLGRVQDFLLDPDVWTLRYVEVETGGPLHASLFLLPVDTVHRISWDTRQVRVAFAAEANGRDV
jgi:uncharacterized protein YrrD